MLQIFHAWLLVGSGQEVCTCMCTDAPAMSHKACAFYDLPGHYLMCCAFLRRSIYESALRLSAPRVSLSRTFASTLDSHQEEVERQPAGCCL